MENIGLIGLALYYYNMIWLPYLYTIARMTPAHLGTNTSYAGAPIYNKRSRFHTQSQQWKQIIPTSFHNAV